MTPSQVVKHLDTLTHLLQTCIMNTCPVFSPSSSLTNNDHCSLEVINLTARSFWWRINFLLFSSIDKGKLDGQTNWSHTLNFFVHQTFLYCQQFCIPNISALQAFMYSQHFFTPNSFVLLSFLVIQLLLSSINLGHTPLFHACVSHCGNCSQGRP